MIRAINILLAALVAATISQQSGPLADESARLINGGFELSPCNNPLNCLIFADSDLVGWRITSGSIDISTGIWRAACGNKSLDLSGSVPGAISQNVAVLPNQTYRLSFAMSGNPKPPGDCPSDAVKTLRVNVPGRSHEFTFDITGLNYQTIRYVNREVFFYTDAAIAKIEFVSLTDGPCGPVIDCIELDEVTPGSDVGTGESPFTTVSVNTESGESRPSDSKRHLAIALGVGIGGGLLLVGLIATAFLVVMHRRRHHSHQPAGNEQMKKHKLEVVTEGAGNGNEDVKVETGSVSKDEQRPHILSGEN